ncbi:hypothetical protein CHARACLAT_029950 [Characodon lateralis]|uniref:Uncharacterized protein n=1 Tax=Characodon lateralis TaxID=208331 RepID=A0ABU7EP01_9TELE|nr:hypothetical protein [Characodon lateralis]
MNSKDHPEQNGRTTEMQKNDRGRGGGCSKTGGGEKSERGYDNPSRGHSGRDVSRKQLENKQLKAHKQNRWSTNTGRCNSHTGRSTSAVVLLLLRQIRCSC